MTRHPSTTASLLSILTLTLSLAFPKSMSAEDNAIIVNESGQVGVNLGGETEPDTGINFQVKGTMRMDGVLNLKTQSSKPSNPVHGDLVLLADGLYLYTSSLGWSKLNGGSTPPPTPPCAQNDIADCQTASFVNVDVITNDSCTSNSISIQSQPAKGTVKVETDQSITYTNTSGSAGQTDSFTYSNGDSTAEVTITLTAPTPEPNPEPSPGTGTGFEQSIEFEDASLSQYATIANGNGAQGNSYVDYPAKYGRADFQISIPESGTYQLDIIYANGGSSSRYLNLEINGTDVQSPVEFPRTSSWKDWRTVTMQIDLIKGENTLALYGFGKPGPNMDYIIIKSL